MSDAVSPVEAEKRMVCPAIVAGCGASLARHTEQLGWAIPWKTHGSAVDTIFLPWNVVVTVVPAAAKPQTVADPGPRCSTIESWSVALSLNVSAAEAPGRWPMLARGQGGWASGGG